MREVSHTRSRIVCFYFCEMSRVDKPTETEARGNGEWLLNGYRDLVLMKVFRTRRGEGCTVSNVLNDAEWCSWKWLILSSVNCTSIEKKKTEGKIKQEHNSPNIMAIHGTLYFRVVHAQSLRLNPKSRNAEKEEMLVPIHCGQSLLWFPVDTLLPTCDHAHFPWRAWAADSWECLICKNLIP